MAREKVSVMPSKPPVSANVAEIIPAARLKNAVLPAKEPADSVTFYVTFVKFATPRLPLRAVLFLAVSAPSKSTSPIPPTKAAFVAAPFRVVASVILEDGSSTTCTNSGNFT